MDTLFSKYLLILNYVPGTLKDGEGEDWERNTKWEVEAVLFLEV